MRRNKPNSTLPMKNRNGLFRHAKTEGVSATKKKDKKYAYTQELRQISEMIASEKPENLKVIADIIAAYQIGGLKVVAQHISEKIKLSEIEANKIIKDRFAQVKSANIDDEFSQNASESKVLSHEAGESENPNYKIIKCGRRFRRFRRTKINSLYIN